MATEEAINALLDLKEEVDPQHHSTIELFVRGIQHEGVDYIAKACKRRATMDFPAGYTVTSNDGARAPRGERQIKKIHGKMYQALLPYVTKKNK